jgi:hypothetical protein
MGNGSYANHLILMTLRILVWYKGNIFLDYDDVSYPILKRQNLPIKYGGHMMFVPQR